MKISKNVALSETGFIFNATTGDTFSVNETGRAILEKLRQDLSREELIESLMNDFESDPIILGKYTDEFLSMLHQFHLIEDK